MMSNDDLMLSDDWSELPGDLLGLIIDTLKKNTFFLLEFIRFGAVCYEWRFFSIQNYEHIKLHSNLPVLLIPSPLEEEEEEEEVEVEVEEEEVEEEEEEEEVENYYEDDEDEQPEQDQYYYKPKEIWKGLDQTRHKNTRSFYSLSQRKVYQTFQLPVPYYKNCRGSSHGWLITVDEQVQPDGTTYKYPVRLLNPFRSVNNEIQLPPLTTIVGVDGVVEDDEPSDSYFLIKAFLSANPSSLSNLSDLTVFGVLGRYKLGFCRPGDSAWTHLPLERQFRPIEDLICYKDRFLAIIQNGSVLELDFAHHLPEPNVKFVARTPANADNLAIKYLVESAGDLLQVHRHLLREEGSPCYSTSGFQVFKLLNDAAAADDDDDKWAEMDTLDGRMLFLGDSSSISLSATDFPGLMSNCIYFTDNNHETYVVDPWVGPHDIGLFNFEDRSVEFDFGDQQSFYWHYYAIDNTIMPPPIWIQPML